MVGAGPARMYVADALIYQKDVPVRVDVYDRLPTPFGLLRYGVAPDHLKMKSLARALQRTLDDDRVRFFGNVTVGKDISVDELRQGYHAVAYTFGASADRRLSIPGRTSPLTDVGLTPDGSAGRDQGPGPPGGHRTTKGPQPLLRNTRERT